MVIASWFVDSFTCNTPAVPANYLETSLASCKWTAQDPAGGSWSTNGQGTHSAPKHSTKTPNTTQPEALKVSRNSKSTNLWQGSRKLIGSKAFMKTWMTSVCHQKWNVWNRRTWFQFLAHRNPRGWSHWWFQVSSHPNNSNQMVSMVHHPPQRPLTSSNRANCIL